MADPTTALALYLALAGVAPADQSDSVPRPDNLTVQALRAQGQITLDGVLSETSWVGAPPVTNFTQREPHEGAAATERTEVPLLFDDDALYVGRQYFSGESVVLVEPVIGREQTM